MEIGELLTRRTALLAMSLYFAALVLRFRSCERSGRLGWSRWMWTVGCVVYLIHIACAFQFMHRWSHAAAYEATARQTAALTGLNWGGGLYLNYAFTAVWVGDVGWWWMGRRSFESRPRSIDWVVHGFMGFIAFNATVIFATGWTRWLGVGACAILGGMVVWRFALHRAP